jgi:hypothetical protein
MCRIRCVFSVARKIIWRVGERCRIAQCYNVGAHRDVEVCARSSRCCRPQHRRGVAQPGRAPGSGPGGRRFKSSLPDQSFQALKLNFWFSVYIDGVEIVDGRVFLDFPLGFYRELQSDLPARTRLSFQAEHRCRVIAYVRDPFFATDGRSAGLPPSN